ncbi:hypothetical protein KP509_29G079400 [Ceratopteris richardii]|uniref:Uncharacterized protein n=1 Tax=Ceratopteris richardii TaxID=49495 RepID=A0A8T2R8B6_CERRI|nr:hypothetical protein KP509_29G079400 [Ceratopteris richardii]
MEMDHGTLFPCSCWCPNFRSDVPCRATSVRERHTCVIRSSLFGFIAGTLRAIPTQRYTKVSVSLHL